MCWWHIGSQNLSLLPWVCPDEHRCAVCGAAFPSMAPHLLHMQAFPALLICSTGWFFLTPGSPHLHLKKRGATHGTHPGQAPCCCIGAAAAPRNPQDTPTPPGAACHTPECMCISVSWRQAAVAHMLLLFVPGQMHIPTHGDMPHVSSSVVGGAAER